MFTHRHLLHALLLLAVTADVALAAWPHDPTTNLPVCTAASTQYLPTIAGDGKGGAFVAWQDYRGGANNYDIYAQHVLNSGTVDPAWPVDGRALCTAANNQGGARIVADGMGGAIVTWQDLRNGTHYDIYAQHVLAGGAADPAWPANGRVLCTAAHDQNSPMIVPDGTGGAIVCWEDLRGGTQNDIYAQHVLASGAVDPAWPADGRALCTAVNQQRYPRLVSDGAGGAIVSWQDLRGGTTSDIYAQRVRADGTVDPAWPADGRALCAAAYDQAASAIVSDGAGGAIVSWHDWRNGTSWDIYAQRVRASGVVDPAWPADGRPLCSAADDQMSPAIVADDAGGAIVTWHDGRTSSHYDIYAQHVLASGAVDPAWPADGRALCTTPGWRTYPGIVPDGAGGAIVSWQDGSLSLNLYAQHVLASGAVDPAWPANGRAVCTASGDQPVGQNETPIVSDGAQGAILAWSDGRNAADTADIYAQRVAPFGYLGTPEAEIASLHDVPADQGGQVELSWNASYLDLASDPNLAAYDVYRSPGGGPLYLWEYLTTVPAAHAASYDLVVPALWDSVDVSTPRTSYRIVARNSAGSMSWPSRSDSARSVDNLAPGTPAPFTASWASGAVHLHWNRNPEADLAGYRLYRGASPNFVPSIATLLAALPDTGYADPASPTYTYKLSALDVHGNESPVATLTPSQIVAVGERPVVRELSLSAPSPNPARRGTVLHFALPAGARVTLGIYDASGRRVRLLVEGTRPAGEDLAAWDLRDAGGRPVGAGLYFARLDVADRTLTRRIAVTP